MMENLASMIKVTIGATFNPKKKNGEQIREFVKNKLAGLKEVDSSNCKIGDENYVEMIVSIPESVFASQGPSNIDEIEEFISIFGPVFLFSERMPIKIKSVKAEISS